MNRKKVIAALEEVCEQSNGCVNCVIEKNSPHGQYCVDNQFENMADADLIIYARIAGIDISEDDPVNHPSHYTSGGIECLDALEASMTPLEYAGFLKGQVFKYIWRYRLKANPVQDLKKACFYLDRLIHVIEKEGAAV